MIQIKSNTNKKQDNLSNNVSLYKIMNIMNKIIQKIIYYIIFLVVKLFSLTIKIKKINFENVLEAQKISPNKSVVFAYWHENIFALLISHSYMGILPMISKSKDGDLIDFIAKKFGYDSVRGSSTRGGKEAKNEMIYKMIYEHKHGALAVDGPRGPRRVLKSGVIAVARDTKSPIILAVAMSSRFWVLKKTWDQTRIPKPFSTVLVLYSKPIFVDSNVYGEAHKEFKKFLENSLNKLEEEIEAYVKDLTRI